MSHLKERSAKNCLNCQADVQGRYCHVCGQENIEPVESTWHLIQHFLYDLTHFDGKFFSTLKTLIAKPGRLSAEYMAGRRNSYLNPIRMYIFTSAVFFLIFFSSYSVEPGREGMRVTIGGRPIPEIRAMDSATFDEFSKEHLDKRLMDRKSFDAYLDSMDRGIHFFERSFRSREEYDSLRKSGAVKHNWLQRQMVYKEISLNKKYNNDRERIRRVFLENFLHSFPQLMFLSLPLFALLLKLLYIRQKKFYYTAHLIFSVNFYIFAFIAMLFMIGVIKLDELFRLNWLAIVKFALIAGVLFYEYKSMKRFYGQNGLMTFFKFCLLNIGHFLIMIGLLMIGLLITVMKS